MQIITWFKNLSIKYKLILLITLWAITVMSLSSWFGIFSQRQLLNLEVKESLKENNDHLNTLFVVDTQLLTASQNFFIQDNDVKNAFILGDREKLYSLALPYYTELQKYSIETIAFVKPNNEIFLRMQRKDIYGDMNDLYLLDKVKQTQKTASGIEVSKRQIALWTISPYKDKENNIIGYILFGENINKFFTLLANQTNNTYAAFINKNLLNKTNIFTATDENSKIIQTNWDKMKDYILINSLSVNKKLYDLCFTENHIANANSQILLGENLNNNGIIYSCVGFPLVDASNTKIGSVLYLENITERSARSSNVGMIMVIMLAILASVGITLLTLFTNAFIFSPLRKAGKIMKSISEGDLKARVPVDSKDEFGQMAIVFNGMTSKLEQLSNAKDEFLSVAAHQLRTPLGSIRWNLEMLLHEDFGKLSTKVQEIVTQIYHSNLRMINLVNDLLDVSRIDQKRMTINPQPIDIIASARQAVAELEKDIQKKSIKLSLDVKNKIPLLTLDAVHFHEVCENLLSNAIKYNKQHGEIKITMNKKEDFVEILLADTGIGIPQKEQDKLFSKFFRASNAMLVDTEGTGLGLFVVKSYIEGCGGSITFTSKEGEGTTFIIKIPLITKFEKEKQNKQL